MRKRSSLMNMPCLTAAACAAALAAAGMALPASAFGAVHTLTCAVPGQAQFLLRSEYTRRLWQSGSDSPWQVRYRMPAQRGRPVEVPLTLAHSKGDDDAPCHRLGVLDGVVMADKRFLQADGRWFDTAKLPPSFWFAEATATGLGLHKHMFALGAVPDDHGFLLPRQGRLVYEVALIVEKACCATVVAVVQSSSGDGGASWTPLAATTDAHIYELGKSPEMQGFAARLQK